MLTGLTWQLWDWFLFPNCWLLQSPGIEGRMLGLFCGTAMVFRGQKSCGEDTAVDSPAQWGAGTMHADKPGCLWPQSHFQPWLWNPECVPWWLQDSQAPWTSKRSHLKSESSSLTLEKVPLAQVVLSSPGPRESSAGGKPARQDGGGLFLPNPPIRTTENLCYKTTNKHKKPLNNRKKRTDWLGISALEE